MTRILTYLYQRQVLGIAIGSVIALYTNSSVAQITPDATLPNNSNVILEGNTFNIRGGSIAGSNLFHSFKDFSVPTGSIGFFNNAVNIQNIISRVTGKSISNIDGLIKANGTANLFLINPNGIIFGESARLDIGGSLLATSANSMKFASGSEFSAVNPATPLLTITAPVGLQFDANPGSIQVQGNGQGGRGIRYVDDRLVSNETQIDTDSGLRVQPDKTLALVGGDINLEGAVLKTAGGRIELGSIKGDSLISLNPTDKGFALNYGGVQNYGNIQLFQQANVDASGEGGGDIQVVGKNVTLSNESQIEASTLAAKPGGSLVVNATELLELNGNKSGLFTLVYPEATANAGHVTINTRELRVLNGAAISSSAFGQGSAGNLTITADNIQVIGNSSDNFDGSGLFASSQANFSGDAGNLTINTRNLLVKNGASVNTATFSLGKGGNLTITADSIEISNFSVLLASSSSTNVAASGNAGNLTINTRELLVQDEAQILVSTFGQGKGGNLTITADSVQVNGASANNRFPTGIITSSAPNSSGDAGELIINTRELLVKNGGQIGAATFGQGKGGNLTITADNVQLTGTVADGRAASGLFTSSYGDLSKDAGNLVINARNLQVMNGAQVLASTFGQGKGGNLTITSDNVQVTGSSANGRILSVLATSSRENSTGDAGDLTINTRQLLVQNEAEVSVDSLGEGNAGSLTINARSIRLNNKASLNSNTQSVNKDPNKPQANININSQDLISRRDSQITANARGENVIGGNINVDAGVLAVLENSRISANSIDFRGGRVTIKTQGIFGIQPWYPVPLRGYITATGANPQLSGTVQINTPDVEPSRGLIELPVNLVDVSNQISNACTPGSRQFDSTFVVTGRGGLPVSPDEPLQDSSTLRAWVKLTPTLNVPATKIEPDVSMPKIAVPTIIEASNWIADKSGNIELVVSTSQFNSSSHKQTPTSEQIRRVC